MDDSDVQEGVQAARRKRDQTVADLNEFDVTQTRALGAIESDLETLTTWVSDMNGLFTDGVTAIDFPIEKWMDLTTKSMLNRVENGQLIDDDAADMKALYAVMEASEEPLVNEFNFNARPVDAMGNPLMTYESMRRVIGKVSPRTSYRPAHMSAVQKLFNAIKESTFGRSVKGVSVGVFDVENGYHGVVDTLKDPIGTFEALKEAASHPIQTSTFIVNSISDSYERDTVNGTAESRSHWVTYALGTTATAVVGTKGVGTVSKTGATATKAAVQKSVTTTQNTLHSLRTLELPQLLPYTPRLELALSGNVPVNVVDGNQLKKNLLMKVEKSTGNPA